MGYQSSKGSGIGWAINDEAMASYHVCSTPRTLSSSSCTLTQKSHRLRPLHLYSSIGLWLSSAPCPLVNPLAVLCWPGPEFLQCRLSHKCLSRPLSCDHSRWSPLTP